MDKLRGGPSKAEQEFKAPVDTEGQESIDKKANPGFNWRDYPLVQKYMESRPEGRIIGESSDTVEGKESQKTAMSELVDIT